MIDSKRVHNAFVFPITAPGDTQSKYVDRNIATSFYGVVDKPAEWRTWVLAGSEWLIARCVSEGIMRNIGFTRTLLC